MNTDSNFQAAPIVLFVYNRPWHTEQTIKALQANYLAKQSDLIIFSDAAKANEQLASVNEVRSLIKNTQGFKSVRIVERNENWGLAKSIIEGVTEIVNQFGSVIVLEDDIVTSPYFLRYMNDALKLYEDDQQVMHITGYNYPINTTNVPEYFFVKLTSCWSWATWRRAWQHYEKNSKKYIDLFDNPKIKDFNFNGSYNYFSQITANYKGRLNTWAIFWYASVYLQNGLSLHPCISFAQNIGHDETGENCGKTDVFDVNLATKYNSMSKITIEETDSARMALENYFWSIKPKLSRRVLNKLLSLFRG